MILAITTIFGLWRALSTRERSCLGGFALARRPWHPRDRPDYLGIAISTARGTCLSKRLACEGARRTMRECEMVKGCACGAKREKIDGGAQ